jgi:hypothetical protein
MIIDINMAMASISITEITINTIMNAEGALSMYNF